MYETLINFTKYLGKKVLVGDRELILKTVSLDHLLCMNGQPELIPVTVDECRIIVTGKKEVLERNINPEICVVKTENGYIPATVYFATPTDPKEINIVEAVCSDSGIKPEQLSFRTRAREVVWARQIMMAVRNRLFNYSFAQSAAIYGKDHATAIHSCKTVDNLMLTDKAWRAKYAHTWKTVQNEFPKAGEYFNLNWLNK
jgi:hypothetical protein